MAVQSAAIRFRLTEEERRLVEEAARAEGKTMSEFVRDRLLDRRTVTGVRKSNQARAKATRPASS